MKLKFLLSWLFLGILFSTAAQKIRYEERSPVYFGLNTGVTWHTSDVENDEYRIRAGGFIFGVALNEDYGNAVSFDIRLRGLFGAWRGLDSDTLGFLSSNNTLNNNYGLANNGPGFAVQNFRAAQAHWALELAIHANSLRERTGFDPYIFGGLSLTTTVTEGDLFNSTGNLYDYANNPTGSIIENTYTTPLDANGEGGIYDTGISNILPTFGFGLGYYITNRLSIGIEHKSTFFNSDYFDGTTVNQNGIINGNNDIYHYTGGYLRWNLKSREQKERERPVTQPTPTTNVDAYTRGSQQTPTPPQVNFTSPNTSPFTTDVETITLRADILHVQRAQDVLFTQDGNVNHNYTYNALSNRFQSSVKLKPGTNVFTLRGTNTHGVATDQMIIVYQPKQPTVQPPTVTITDPSNNPHTSNAEQRIVRATIQHVGQKGDVTMEVNGQTNINFTFTPAGNNNFSATIPLNVGPNIVRITGKNNYGTATDEVTIIYERKPQEPSIEPPVVQISSPHTSPFSVVAENFNLIASVLNIDEKNQIIFRQNGVINNNFTFNPTSKNFGSAVVLKPGANIFQIVATNAAGTDQKTVVINYEIPSPKPPIVSINTPSTSPYSTTSPNQSLIATVLNVDNASQIEMKVNGNNFSQFSFNANTSVLTSVIALQVGQNVVSVRGTNSDGTDIKSTTILYRKPLQDPPPVVTIIEPTVSPYTTEQDVENVLATVDNVTVKSQINVNINGLNTTNFTFNPSNGVVQLSANLILGANTVTITGTNAVGADTKTTTILYRKPKEEHPPVVTFVDPLQNPTTVYSAIYNVKVKVEHVTSSQDISLVINGLSSSQFTYNPASQIMEFTTSLVNGANLIQVTGSNDYGQDTETTTIIYQKIDPILPPVVTITTPIQPSYSVSSSSTPIVATVLNVVGKSDIDVFVNGNMVSNFTYNTSSKVLSFNMSLNEGSNEVLIIGKNVAGSAQDNRTIIYLKNQTIDPPLVTFVNPGNPGKEIVSPTFQMIATVDNVESKNNVQLKFDGQVINPANFTFNTVSKKVVYNANLSFGNNTFEVKGTNAAGEHHAITNVIYLEPEPDCDEPSIAFIHPAQNNSTVSEEEFDLKALIHNVASQNQIQLKLNGEEIGNFAYSPLTHKLSRKISLSEGNNIIEIRVLTDCGVAYASKLIKYTPPTVICDDPIISLVEPRASNYTTQEEQLTVFATVSHVNNIQQLQFLVNGSAQPFNYDLGTHSINSTVSLSLGYNTIKIIATNDCESVYDQWTIKREVCQEPMATLTINPAGNVVSTHEVVVSGTISEVSQNQIQFTVNGKNHSFVYEPNTQSFYAAVTLNEGANNIQVLATNNCGVSRTLFNTSYEPVIVEIDPPTVSITNPSSSPYVSENGIHSVVAAVTNISAPNQISVAVNGANKMFNFNAQSQQVTFNLNLLEGDNVIVINVSNDGGTASDTKTIVYTKPMVIEPPLVVFTNPTTLSTEKADGMYNISGTVANLTSLNQLQVMVNNTLVNNVLANITPSGITFSFMLAVSASHDNYEITAEGTNAAGSDSKTIFINRLLEDDEDDEPANCQPTIGAEFSSDAKRVTASSDKDLSNVVLKFSDHTTQKFDGLSGLSQTFSGTGQHDQKCIVGIWIKSGCNLSGDGPGYGEYVPNLEYDGRCENVPCEAPELAVSSASNVSDKQYTFVFTVTHVQPNEVGVILNNAPLNCSFNAGTNTFSCNVELNEGNNTFIITADGCETTTKIHDVVYVNPCKPISFARIYPASAQYSVNTNIIDVNLTVDEVMLNGISATLNGISVTPILSGNSLFISIVSLNEGVNNLVVQLSNDCSNETVNYAITYVAPGPCGPRINPGNSDWQFCLVTPSGTFNRSNLQDPNFTYNGPASSIYFLPIAGGGDVTVNGASYPVQSGQYYLFEGNLSVEVSSQKPGAMGHWTVCITADAEPTWGNGGRRPASPCEAKNMQMEQPKPSGTQTAPARGNVEQGTSSTPTPTQRPTTTTRSTQKSTTQRPTTTTRPAQNNSTRPTETPTTRQRPSDSNTESNSRGTIQNQQTRSVRTVNGD
jgi:hypothetical protein